MALKIDRHIPTPTPRVARNTGQLKKLKVNDSILLPCDTAAERGAWYQAAHRLGVKVSIQTTNEGARLWRTE